MNSANNNNNSESFEVKKVKPRYIVINEDIFQTLTPDSLKVYMTFRYESDYSTECSSVKKNIKFLENKTNLSRRQVFYCLQELEQFGLIKREMNQGYQSTYWVAQDMGYFLPKVQETKEESTEIDQPPVHEVHGVVHEVHGVVHEVHHIINNSLQQSLHLKPIVDFDKSTSYKDDELFMRFYSLYPNKQKPEIARKSFYKHKPNDEFVSMLCADVCKRVENNWKNRPKEKIPHPSTYLNTKEWEGEIYPAESNVTAFPKKPNRYTMQELTGGLL